MLFNLNRIPPYGLPFLESLSNRLPALEEEFHILLHEEWNLEPPREEQPDPEKERKQKEEDRSVALYMAEQIGRLFPAIEKELKKLIEQADINEEPPELGPEAQDPEAQKDIEQVEPEDEPK